MIRTKRTYDAAARGDGRRFLVERLWPRGMKKESLVMEGWLKEVAPSAELRKWFDHRVERWEEFQRRNDKQTAFAIPSPRRREEGNWVIEPVPLIKSREARKDSQAAG